MARIIKINPEFWSDISKEYKYVTVVKRKMSSGEYAFLVHIHTKAVGYSSLNQGNYGVA